MTYSPGEPQGSSVAPKRTITGNGAGKERFTSHKVRKERRLPQGIMVAWMAWPRIRRRTIFLKKTVRVMPETSRTTKRWPQKRMEVKGLRNMSFLRT